MVDEWLRIVNSWLGSSGPGGYAHVHNWTGLLLLVCQAALERDNGPHPRMRRGENVWLAHGYV